MPPAICAVSDKEDIMEKTKAYYAEDLAEAEDMLRVSNECIAELIQERERAIADNNDALIADVNQKVVMLLVHHADLLANRDFCAKVIVLPTRRTT